MKTIDTKSLLLGVIATLFVLTLTSGKMLESESNLDITERDRGLVIFNKQTMTLYEYYPKLNGSIQLKPDNTYKISSDGSSLEKK